MGWLRKKTPIEADSTVDAAIASWRQAGRGTETLSPSSRADLFARVSAGGPELSGTATLFPPVRRWALAAGIPLVLTCGLAWLAEREGESPRPGLRIQATKQGEDVVFTIADGRRVHRVVRSETPERFDSESAVRVRSGGSFRDDAETGADLVFYRID
jgi:hypothetical protein